MTKSKLLQMITWLSIALGTFLLIINTYGILKTTRIPQLQNKDVMRFKDDITLSLPELQKQLRSLENETDIEYAKRLTKVISDGIAHIDSIDSDSLDFYFRIKLWDNWIYFLISHIPFLPEEEWRHYHYMNLPRTIERGVGNCGDAALLIAYMLEKKRLMPKVVAFPKHVVTEVTFPKTNDTLFLDPDFGVWAKGSINSVTSNPEHVRKIYSEAGYPESDIYTLNNIYSEKADYYTGYKEFSPKKYYLEQILYIFKWLIPILLILISAIYLIKRRSNK